jgi:hypothetical protein
MKIWFHPQLKDYAVQINPISFHKKIEKKHEHLKGGTSCSLSKEGLS